MEMSDRLAQLQDELEQTKEKRKNQLAYLDNVIYELEARILDQGDWEHTRRCLGGGVFLYETLREAMGKDIRYQRKRGKFKK